MSCEMTTRHISLAFAIVVAPPVHLIAKVTLPADW